MAESSETGNIVGVVARRIGVQEPVVRLMVALLTGNYHSELLISLFSVLYRLILTKNCPLREPEPQPDPMQMNRASVTCEWLRRI